LKLTAGPEVYGLRRVFLEAGARSLVMRLLSVLFLPLS